jgi:hypothetical protein
VQKIADWLERLGMSEYAQRFAENRIDFSVLAELTDQDLKELGVVLGDRRKILRAIAKLRSQSGSQHAFSFYISHSRPRSLLGQTGHQPAGKTSGIRRK